MNNFKKVLFLICIAAFTTFLTACGEEKENNVEVETTNPVPTSVNPEVQINTPTTDQQVTNQDGDVVYHYICPNGDGGGDAQGTCPTCGETLVHNAAFHQQGDVNRQEVDPATQPIPTPTTPLPAQNANGEYHYTCPEGHEGGSGDKGAVCEVCGATLQHNAAYHN